MSGEARKTLFTFRGESFHLFVCLSSLFKFNGRRIEFLLVVQSIGIRAVVPKLSWSKTSAQPLLSISDGLHHLESHEIQDGGTQFLRDLVRVEMAVPKYCEISAAILDLIQASQDPRQGTHIL